MNFPRAEQMLSKLRIKHRDSGRMVPFRLNPNQKKAFDIAARQWEEEGKVSVIILKARRVGMSSLFDSLLFLYCLWWSNAECLIVAHVKDTSEGLFRVPRDLAHDLNLVANCCDVYARQIAVRHKSGRSILDIATAGSVVAGRGLTLGGLHISEAAQIGTQGSFTSLLPAVSKGRNTIKVIESTAFGKSGIGENFYRQWKSAEAGRSEFRPIFLSWLEDSACVANPESAEDAPATDLERELMKDFGATKSQIAWMRNVMETECQGIEKIWLQEYPHTPEVAFQSTGDPAFTRDELIQAARGARNAPSVGYLAFRGGSIAFDADRRGGFHVWQPPQSGHKYYIGVDAAVGVEHGDFAAMCVLDGTTGEQAAKYDERVNPEIMAHLVNVAGRWYNNALVNIELSGNSGAELQRVLRDKLFYGNLYLWKGKDDKVAGQGSKQTLGWWMTSDSRRKLIETFRHAIRGASRGDDFRFVIRDPALVSQMEEATNSDSGRWEIEKGHDDVLVAAMLSCVAYAQYPPPGRAVGSNLMLVGEQEENARVAAMLPDLREDATFSLGSHLKRVDAINRRRQQASRRGALL